MKVKCFLLNSLKEVRNILISTFWILYYAKKTISCFSLSVPSGSMMYSQERLFFAEVFPPGNGHQHIKFSWKPSDQIQTKSISLLTVFNYAVLQSLTCAGKRGKKRICELSLIEAQGRATPSVTSCAVIAPHRMRACLSHTDMGSREGK